MRHFCLGPVGPALGLPPAVAGWASFGIPGIFMDQSGSLLSPAERRASLMDAEQAGTPMTATKTEGPRLKSEGFSLYPLSGDNVEDPPCISLVTNSDGSFSASWSEPR